MDRYTQTLECQNQDSDLTSIRHIPKKSARSNRSASRLFGYDFFVSFAMDSTIDNDEKSGQVKPKRGTQKYAAELTRKLENEERLTVFFSEKSMAAGEEVPNFLKKALLNSKVLVVLINKETLLVPGYVRKEVKIFEEYCSTRKILIINIDGALDGDELSSIERDWLQKREIKKIPESAQAIESGIVSDSVLAGIINAREHIKSETWWRWVKGGVIAILLVLSIGFTIGAFISQARLKHALSLTLVHSAASLELEKRWLVLLAAKNLSSSSIVDTAILSELQEHIALKKLAVADSIVSSVAVNKEGTRIVTGHGNGALMIWDAKSVSPIFKNIGFHGAKVQSVAFSQNGTRILLGSSDGMIRLLDAKNFESIGEPKNGDLKCIYSVAFSPTPDSNLAASGGCDGTLRVWDTKDGMRLKKSLNGHENLITSVDFRNDDHLLSVNRDGTLRLWDAKTGFKTERKISEETEIETWVTAHSPDGMYAVSGDSTGVLYIWDTGDLHSTGGPIKAHSGAVTSLTFEPAGKLIATTGFDRTVHTWSTFLRVRYPIKPIELTSYAVGLSFIQEGLISVDSSGQIMLWNRQLPNSIGHILVRSEIDILDVAFSQNGTRFVTATSDKKLQIWDTNTGQPIAASRGSNQHFRSVAISPDGEQVASGSDDGQLQVWNAESPLQQVGVFSKVHKDAINSLVYSRDGKRILSAGDDQTIIIWDAKTRLPIHGPLKTNGEVTSAIFSPDQKLILVGGFEDNLRFWDAQSGEPIGDPIKTSELGITSVAFSPDGSSFLSGGFDSQAQQWDTKTRQRIGDDLEQNTSITSVAFDPDGSYMVTGGLDGSLNVWDAESHQNIGELLNGHDQSVSRISIVHDGNTIASVGDDDTVRLWPAPKAWPAELCKKLTRNMSHKEWREWVSPDIDYIEQCPDLPIPPGEPTNATNQASASR